MASWKETSGKSNTLLPQYSSLSSPCKDWIKSSSSQDLVHLEELGDGGNNGAVSEQDGGVAADEGQVTVAGKAKIKKIKKITKIKKTANFFGVE